jgi:hypothetical protein
MLACGGCQALSTCNGNQCTCGNRDGDGLDDCVEANDGDPWTDPDIFNGMRVRQRNQCSASGNCNENNTRAKVTSCMSGSIQQTLDQYAGWDWNNPPDDICSSGYGFRPNWTQCDSTWQAEWSGVINLAQAGNHCFNITGSTNEGCGSLFFDTATNGIQTGAPTQCFDVAAGVYPILWHYTMDNGSSSSMHVNYCFGGASTCTPSTAIPASMLRTTP